MQSLGAQDRKQPVLGLVPGERWVLIPAGVGVVAAIIAAARLVEDSDQNPRETEQSYVQAAPAQDPRSFVAVADRWLSFHDDIAVGLEQGSRLDHGIDPGIRVLQFVTGRATVAVSGSPVEVVGKGFSADLQPGSVAIFESRTHDTLVRAMVGTLSLTFSDGSRITLLEGTDHAVPFVPVQSDEPSVPTAHESDTLPVLHGTSPASDASGPPMQVPVENGTVALAAPGSTSSSVATSQPPNVTGPVVPVSPPVAAPFDPGWIPPGLIEPPSSESDAGYGPHTDNRSPGNGTANSNAGGNGNGNGAANSNAGGNGNGNGPTNPDAGGSGNGNGAANSNAGGNGNGNSPANPDAGGKGNGNGVANSNAGGSGNGNGTANSNAGGNGNGNGPANPDAGGKGNGSSPANSNAGGNGNGSGATNSNAGGNENGNGATNSNAGGNENGNGTANSNAGGNGNGNGAANSNAGGNGNGNGAAKKT